MNKGGIKEKSQDKEHPDELFSDESQSGALSEYEFFVPEIGQPKEPVPFGEKKKDDDQKSELVDFFLHN